MIELSMVVGMLSYSIPLGTGAIAHYFKQRKLRESGIIMTIALVAAAINMIMYFVLPAKTGVAVGTAFNFFFMTCYVVMVKKWYKLLWEPLILGFIALLVSAYYVFSFSSNIYVPGCDALSNVFLSVVCLNAIVYLMRMKFDYRSLFMIGALVYGSIQIPTLLAGQFLTIDEWASIWWLMGLSAVLYNVINEIGVVLCLKTE